MSIFLAQDECNDEYNRALEEASTRRGKFRENKIFKSDFKQYNKSYYKMSLAIGKSLYTKKKKKHYL